MKNVNPNDLRLRCNAKFLSDFLESDKETINQNMQCVWAINNNKFLFTFFFFGKEEHDLKASLVVLFRVIDRLQPIKK